MNDVAFFNKISFYHDDLSDVISIKTVNELFSYIKNNNKLFTSRDMDLFQPDEKSELYQYLSNPCWLNNNGEMDVLTFLSLSEIARENTELAPGAVLSRFGIIVIAHTEGGNGICINMKNGAIYFADHSIFCGKNCYCFPSKHPVTQPFTMEIVISLMKPISLSLERFINEIALSIIDLEID